MRFAAVLLAVATTALGYTITTPNQSAGWTNQGAQPVAWSRVSTDRQNITIVLSNPDKDLMPTPQVLAALVDGDLGNTTVNPPSAGWPSPGTGYVVSFVAEVTNLNAILAQSPSFEIELSTVVPSSTRTTPVGSQTTGVSGSTPTDDTVSPNNGNGALSRFGVPVGLVALAGVVPALFA
ncbi:hypothetical protein NMY22_g2419 [Coprinellus aureogranulatus]|nr:hypothetical protein NMY22_g2419 [Coprinellus aureogranulatus]